MGYWRLTHLTACLVPASHQGLIVNNDRWCWHLIATYLLLPCTRRQAQVKLAAASAPQSVHFQQLESS